jgi:membrane fusion protein, multidrug efflux system
VSTAIVVEKAVPLDVAAVGTAEAVSTVQIRAQTTGQLGEINFAEGQDVTKGQLLFVLDPRPFDLALQQAQAVLARDTAQATNAQLEVARYKPLLDRGLIPREQFDSVTANAAATQATTGADEAAVETANLNLQYTRITAPISGRAGSLMVHSGDLIRANDTTPMVTINQITPIYVSFSVPGKLLDDIRAYQAQAPLQAQALVTGAHPVPVTGRVTFIDNAVDPTSGTIRLKALFDNPHRDLWPGQFVNVSLRLTSDPHAVVAPATAVQASQKGQYVYVVKGDHTVEMRAVDVSRTVGPEAVIARGLQRGETVVTDGQLRLTPGAHVAVRPSVVATGATR